LTADSKSNENLDLKSKLRIVPGFPKKGVNFVDITTLLVDPASFRKTIDVMTRLFAEHQIDLLVGIEARGFMIGAPIAYNLTVGFVPARKKGKLPGRKLAQEYSLEYGSELLEMHDGSISRGQRVGIVDDLLATGGTARAAAKLVEKMGGKVACLGFLVELDFLHGRRKIRDYDMFSLVHYSK
jgi:adenine phosphoribosyltransferase